MLDTKFTTVNDEDCPDGCDDAMNSAFLNCLKDDIDKDFEKCVFDQIPEGSKCYDCFCNFIYVVNGEWICSSKKNVKVETFRFSSKVKEVKDERKNLATQGFINLGIISN